MIGSYIKIAFRNLLKHKGYSAINIIGLAIGMACCILILLWVQHETSYNRFHENRDDIYRAYQINRHAGGATPFSNLPQPVGPELKRTVSEIKYASRVLHGDFTTKYNDKNFNETDVLWIDSSFFEMFTFPFIQGDVEAVFSDPYSVILTEDTAKKYFGKDDPIGKVLMIDRTDQLTVRGIVKNVPDNSSIQYDILVPYSNLEAVGYNVNKWDSHNCQIYAQLEKDIAPQQVEQKIIGLIKNHTPELDSDLRLQPLKHRRLYTLGGEMGTIKYVYMFSIIALFVLLIASINFMNLSTARSSKRAREVGLRKVVGARRMQIIRQFFGESMIITLISFALAIVLVEALMPLFNQVSGKELSLNLSENILIYLGLFGIAILTGLLSGSYPAIFLSSFLPTKVLKGSLWVGTKSSGLRKALVVFQFSLSIMLIISTAIVYSQLKYIQNKDLGFNRNNLIYIPMNKDIRANFDAIRNQMLQNPHIQNVTRTFQIPSYNRYSSEVKWEGQTPDQNIDFNISIVDSNYLDTLGLSLMEGRNFSEERSTDTAHCIINEEAKKQMSLDSPLGKWLESAEKGEIIGVVNDYHYMPFTYEIEPLLLLYRPIMYRFTMARISGQNTPSTIEHIKTIWNKFAIDYPFEYHFLDEDYEQIYWNEQRMGRLFQYFTVLAIFISCLGLFGLASFMAEQRTKEIGIRKVLGASVSGITVLLSKEFTKWVIIGNVIAWPVAYLAMKSWLQGFAYCVDINLLVFIFSGLLALCIAVITVSYQSIRAAISDPVEALRYE
ncbi:ABC transporter permease [Acidobacteriota bacterium]